MRVYIIYVWHTVYVCSCVCACVPATYDAAFVEMAQPDHRNTHIVCILLCYECIIMYEIFFILFSNVFLLLLPVSNFFLLVLYRILLYGRFVKIIFFFVLASLGSIFAIDGNIFFSLSFVELEDVHQPKCRNAYMEKQKFRNTEITEPKSHVSKVPHSENSFYGKYRRSIP